MGGPGGRIPARTGRYPHLGIGVRGVVLDDQMVLLRANLFLEATQAPRISFIAALGTGAEKAAMMLSALDC